MQESLVVLSAIENPNDYDLRSLYPEYDRSPPLETYSAEARADIVASRSAPGKRLQRLASGLDTVDVPFRNRKTRFLGDVVIKPEQISFSERTEADLELVHFRLAFTRSA